MSIKKIAGWLGMNFETASDEHGENPGDYPNVPEDFKPTKTYGFTPIPR